MTSDSTQLSSTQIGAIAELLVANTLMVHSRGRLSPFRPVADDDGIDLLIYDKLTGRALPAQVKSRTVALKRPGTDVRGNTVHFELRKATFRSDRYACCLLLLLANDISCIERSWVIPMRELPACASDRTAKYVIRANKVIGAADRFSRFQCQDPALLVSRVLALLEQSPAPGPS